MLYSNWMYLFFWGEFQNLENIALALLPDWCVLFKLGEGLPRLSPFLFVKGNKMASKPYNPHYKYSTCKSRKKLQALLAFEVYSSCM